MDFPFHHSDQVLFLPASTQGLFVTRWRSPERGPGWLVASDPVETLVAHSVDQVEALLARAQPQPFAAGYVAYEAAPAFDPGLSVHDPAGEPLAVLRLYEAPPVWYRALNPLVGDAQVARAEPAVDFEWYSSRFERVQRGLRDGTLYQANLTFPMQVEVEGHPWDLFVAINGVTSPPYATFFDAPDASVLSFSPELFFEQRGRHVRCRPMKGTATRQPNPIVDLEAVRLLRSSEKERAENLMIVDMVRNDLGRIAEVGSVHVDSLFEVERYPTVWQMTSQVSCSTDASLPEVFRAIFPGASVTGAPKGSAMGVLRELEAGPRGVYTGALGFGAGTYSRFSLPIRTLTLGARPRCPVGSGVVWDSECDREWSECLAKAAYLTAPVERFALLETMRWDPVGGFALWERHCQRLRAAARTLEVPLDLERVSDVLDSAVDGLRSPQRVRLTVDLLGAPIATALPLMPSHPISARLATAPVPSSDPLLSLKTTLRDAYCESEGEEDVLHVNERGELTEFSIGNVVLERSGRFLTPPLSCGVLPGTLRAQLVDEGALQEAVLTEADLRDADAVYRINSVRGWQLVTIAISR